MQFTVSETDSLRAIQEVLQSLFVTTDMDRVNASKIAAVPLVYLVKLSVETNIKDKVPMSDIWML